jgi:hypothetical protein
MKKLIYAKMVTKLGDLTVQFTMYIYFDKI